MQIKFSTGFILLATAALSTAAGIPVPDEAGLEKRVEDGWMKSPGWRDGADGDKKFAWSKCHVLEWTTDFHDNPPGKMMAGDLHPVRGDLWRNRWCWLTLDGEHRVLKGKDDGDQPDLGKSDGSGGYPDSKYSCLTPFGYAYKSDRHYHGGCFESD